MRQIIQEFLEATPGWLERMFIQARVAWSESNCFLCGTNYQKIKELYEAISEDSGKIEVKIIK